MSSSTTPFSADSNNIMFNCLRCSLSLVAESGREIQFSHQTLAARTALFDLTFLQTASPFYARPPGCKSRAVVLRDVGPKHFGLYVEERKLNVLEVVVGSKLAMPYIVVVKSELPVTHEDMRSDIVILLVESSKKLHRSILELSLGNNAQYRT
ncbi:unnamed protein product [Sphenostylis stenocarpa]|uniref:Uncharacterized protein n=1 Tax=Sphenostylis stenocarpa TaxID=92480 RepID=A0AA86SKY9_9FABA|nr:unnamed protein product [Sphenostylis stenocarpa]